MNTKLHSFPNTQPDFGLSPMSQKSKSVSDSNSDSDSETDSDLDLKPNLKLNTKNVKTGKALKHLAKIESKNIHKTETKFSNNLINNQFLPSEFDYKIDIQFTQRNSRNGQNDYRRNSSRIF